MKVLISCEYSGTVRDAFKALGHYALSCDLLPTEKPGNHYHGSVLDVINNGAYTLKTCNCKLTRNWPFMVSHCKHGFLLVEEKAPLRPLKGPTAADQVQGKGVVAKSPLEGLEGL